MNEGLLVVMMGEIDPSLLEEESMEADLEKEISPFLDEAVNWEKPESHHTMAKVVAGITAGSLIATAGIILVIKFHKGKLEFPFMKKMKV
ncbi:MAG: hypothetical protein WBI07_00085 [Mobilitalea sp.]